MTNQAKIQLSWNEFKEKYSREILPIYLEHELTFDEIGIHGRRHLTRSLIFAEILARFYFLLGEQSLDFEGIRTAVSFHDSGREGNGIDEWEFESAENCKKYLLQHGKTATYAQQISQMIPQKKVDIKTREEQIVYDVDVIEIMRVLWQANHFRKEELYFLGKNNFHRGFPPSILRLQKQFLNEFWTFLEATEEVSFAPTNENFVTEYNGLFRKDKERYKLMNLVFSFEGIGSFTQF